jgi:MYXO-CTERM domain-containing protein
MPTDTSHANPTLNGMCTAAAAALVCASGVCDPKGNVCGIELGDPGCGTTAQCIGGVCITTGPNTGKCEPCAGDISCEAPTPACNLTTNTCVQCTATNTTACTAVMVCNLLTNTCGGGGAVDGGVDSGVEAGLEAGTDSGMVVADAGEEAAPPDAAADAGGPDARADSGAPPVDAGEDAASPAADASDGGFVEGGGCSCKTAGAADDGPYEGAMGAALGGIGLLAARRRRRSA